MGDVNIKRVQRRKYLGNILTEEGKCDTEIRTTIELPKETFQMVSKALRKKSVKNKDNGT